MLRFAPRQVCFANIAPVHRLAVPCSFDQATYETKEHQADGLVFFCLCYHYKIDPYKAVVQKQSMLFAARVHLSLGIDGS